MAKKIRNEIVVGIIVAVASGIILLFFESARDKIFSVINFILTVVLLGWGWLFSGHSTQGWVLLLLSGLAAIGVITIYMRTRPIKEPEYNNYVTDLLHGAKWKWRWRHNSISGLWCFCPTCDGFLVYDDYTRRSYLERENKTEFICENCGNKVVAFIGGDKDYAIAAVTREIDRRVRTGEYKSKISKE
jgi:hypothetical protein